MPGLKNEADFIVVANSLEASSGGVDDNDVRGNRCVLEAYGGNDTRGALDVATACRAKGGSGHGDFESETFLVQAEPICFSSKDYGADASEIAPTLRAAGHHESHANAGAPPAIVEAYQQQGSNVGPMGTLRRGNGNEQGGVPFMVDDGVAHTLRAEGHDASEDGTGRGPPLTVGSHGSVRRLTVLECEKLQGFPPGHTLIPTSRVNHKDPEQIAYLRRQRPNLTDAEIAKLAADGPRYKAIGNSMAVNVMRWIGVRIENEREAA